MANKAKAVSDGAWLSLDGRELYEVQKAAGMLYKAALRAELSRSLHLSWEPVDKNGVAEIRGVPTELSAAWSSRRDAVKAAHRRAGGRARGQSRPAPVSQRAHRGSPAGHPGHPAGQDRRPYLHPRASLPLGGGGRLPGPGLPVLGPGPLPPAIPGPPPAYRGHRGAGPGHPGRGSRHLRAGPGGRGGGGVHLPLHRHRCTGGPGAGHRGGAGPPRGARPPAPVPGGPSRLGAPGRRDEPGRAPRRGPLCHPKRAQSRGGRARRRRSRRCPGSHRGALPRGRGGSGLGTGPRPGRRGAPHRLGLPGDL
ncbi:MAG: relaxase domain-containing protein, partial [Acidimicrobiales bacterium]